MRKKLNWGMMGGGEGSQVGQAEGMLGAFGNIYLDLAELLCARSEGRDPDPSALSYPTGEEGLHTLAVVHAAAASARDGGVWIDL